MAKLLKYLNVMSALSDIIDCLGGKSHIHQQLNRIDSIKDSNAKAKYSVINGPIQRRNMGLLMNKCLNELYGIVPETWIDETNNAFQKRIDTEFGKSKSVPMRLFTMRQHPKCDNMKKILNTKYELGDSGIKQTLGIASEFGCNYLTGVGIKYAFVDAGANLKSVNRDTYNFVNVINPGSFFDSGSSPRFKEGDIIFPEIQSDVSFSELYFSELGMGTTMRDISFNRINHTSFNVGISVNIGTRNNNLKSYFIDLTTPQQSNSNFKFVDGNPTKNEYLINNCCRLNDTSVSNIAKKYIITKLMGDAMQAIFADKFITVNSDAKKRIENTCMFTRDKNMTTRCRLLNIPVLQTYDIKYIDPNISKWGVSTYYYPPTDSLQQDNGVAINMENNNEYEKVKNDTIMSIEYNLKTIRYILLNSDPHTIISFYKVNMEDNNSNSESRVYWTSDEDENTNSIIMLEMRDENIGKRITDLIFNNNPFNATISYFDAENNMYHITYDNNPDDEYLERNYPGKSTEAIYENNSNNRLRDLRYHLIYIHNMISIFKYRVCKFINTSHSDIELKHKTSIIEYAFLHKLLIPENYDISLGLSYNKNIFLSMDDKFNPDIKSKFINYLGISTEKILLYIGLHA